MYFFILVSCSCNFDNLSPSRLLLTAWLCIREGSGFLQKKGGSSWRAAGPLVYHAAVTRILHVSCLMLQSINWVCCSPEAPLYLCGAPNLVQQPVSYLLVKSCCLLSDWGYRVNWIYSGTTQCLLNSPLIDECAGRCLKLGGGLLASTEGNHDNPVSSHHPIDNDTLRGLSSEQNPNTY